MTEKKTFHKKTVLGLVLLAVLVVVLGAMYFAFRAKPVSGSKSVSIEVVNKAQEKTEYKVKTDAEYLRQVMEEAEGLTFSGAESEFGMMVDTVNGETAVYEIDSAYWSFYVNGEYCNYGIDTQPVNDGDVFTISYTVSTQ